MTTIPVAVPAPVPIPAGEVVAANVSADDYMEQYAGDFYEWVEGYVVKMAPVTYRHDEITGYDYILLKGYFALNPIGEVKRAPFVMRVDATNSRREPDLQIILKTNPGQMTETAMIGAADICIEVVSPESVAHDYGEKFVEYEKGGVREYWIFDPIRTEALFYRLGADGKYSLHRPDEQGNYTTPLLPRFRLHAPLHWEDFMPDFFRHRAARPRHV